MKRFASCAPLPWSEHPTRRPAPLTPFSGSFTPPLRGERSKPGSGLKLCRTVWDMTQALTTLWLVGVGPEAFPSLTASC